MDREEVWRTIDGERLSLANTLAELSDEEWAHPSLCQGWTVKDVAAHLGMVNASVSFVLVEAIRTRGSMARMIHDSAVRLAARRTTGQIVAQIRGLAGVHKPAMTTTHLETLIDTLVHAQDMLVPLGRQRKMPQDAAAAAATRIWAGDKMFNAPIKAKGFRLTATDVSWSKGDGIEVRAPIAELLLLLTGRPHAVKRLDGKSAAELKARFTS